MRRSLVALLLAVLATPVLAGGVFTPGLPQAGDYPNTLPLTGQERLPADTQLPDGLTPQSEAITIQQLRQDIQRRTTPSVSVLDFGAVCDGVTDDTVAFNKALVAGTVISVPNGTCYIAGALATTTDGAGLAGAGMFATVIKFGSAPATDGASLLFASPNPTSASYAIHNPSLRDLTLTYGTLSVTQGALLRFQMAAAYSMHHVSLEGGFTDWDVVGSGWAEVDDLRVSSGGSWASPQAGSSLIRIREQPLAGGGSQSSYNHYISNINACGIGYNKIDKAFWVQAIDTLHIVNSYTCGGYTATFALDPPAPGDGAYIANVHYGNGMIDGAGHTSANNIYSSSTCNASTCQNITFTANTIANSGGDGINLIGGPGKFIASANNFSSNFGRSITIAAAYTASITSNTFSPYSNLCDIQIPAGGAGAADGGGITIATNQWTTQSATNHNLYPGVCFTGTSSGGGAVNIVGNNFASLIAPIEFESPTKLNVNVSGNVGDNLPRAPSVLVGKYSANASLAPVTQIAVLTGSANFTTTLPPAGFNPPLGAAITISNASTVAQTTTAFYDSAGNPVTVIAAGVTVWTVWDGSIWRQQAGPSYAVGPSVDQGGSVITLGPLQSTIYVGSAVASPDYSLPDPTKLLGLEYWILNNNAFAPAISTWYDAAGGTHTTVPANTHLHLKSVVGKWVQV